MKELRGRCLCGAVEYAMPDDLKYAGYCYCSECRRFSGSAFSAFGGVTKASFRVIKGAENVAHYQKSENTILGFCRTCGSSLYAEKPKRDMVHVRLGTLNEAPALQPQFHSFVGSKASWFHIKDDLPQFNAARPRG